MKLYEKALEKRKLHSKFYRLTINILKVTIGLMVVGIVISFASMHKPILPELLGKYYDMFSDTWRTLDQLAGMMFMIFMIFISVSFACIGLLLGIISEIYKIFNTKYFKYSEQSINNYLEFKKNGSKDILRDELRKIMMNPSSDKYEQMNKIYDMFNDNIMVQEKRTFKFYEEFEKNYDVEI